MSELRDENPYESTFWANYPLIIPSLQARKMFPVMMSKIKLGFGG
jgi:hypothetical protein